MSENDIAQEEHKAAVAQIIRAENERTVRIMNEGYRYVDNPSAYRREAFDANDKLVAFLDEGRIPCTNYPFIGWQFEKPWGYFLEVPHAS
jgi:hypothetical protein